MTANRSMTVLHVLGGLNPSGMERMLVSAAPRFAERGVASIVIGQGVHHPYRAELEAAGYDVQIFDRGIVADFGRFRTLAARTGTIHIHTEGDYLRTAFLCRMAGGRRTRIVRTVHNVFLARGRWRISRVLQSVIGDRFVDAIAAPSPDVVENERRFFRRARLIYNWVDPSFAEIRPRRFAAGSLERHPHVALIVGNCSDIKNHGFALRVISDAGWHVAHVGDERQMPPSESALLAALESTGSVVHRGIGDPRPHLVSASAFLMPSLFEGMGVALAEAIVAGAPCVIANVPGLQWARGIDGVHSVDLVEHCWQSVLEQLGSESTLAGKDAPDFSPDRGVTEYLDLYGVVG